MSKHNVLVTLQQMQDFALEVTTMAQNRHLQDLLQDKTLLRALERTIQLIGEAANCLPADFQQRYPDVEWSEIIGMRNILVHGYDIIRHEVLWDTATSDIPKLLKQLETILQPLALEND